MAAEARPLAEHLAEYKEQGYTVFAALHGVEWVRQARELLDLDFARHFELRGKGPFWQGAETGRVAVAPALQAWDAPRPFGAMLMDDVLCHPRILDFAELVMGPFVQLDSCEVTGYPGYGVAGNDGTSDGPRPGQSWHRDGFDTSKEWSAGQPTQLWRGGTAIDALSAEPRIEAARRSYTPPLACNYLTYLQDQDGTEASSPLRVIPGSHRDYLHINDADTNKPHAREVLVSAPAGSVIFTHCGLYHSGSLNLRPSTRYFISCYINRLGLPVRDVQSGALVQAKIITSLQVRMRA